MKYWIPCSPIDKASMTMMRFILATCQDVKMYTMRRIVLGDRRGSNKPLDNLMNEWLHDYTRMNRVVGDMPVYALKDAMREVMVRGVKTSPEQRLDWNGFSLEARKGWRKEKEEATTITWEEYTSGKEKKKPGEGDRRTVRLETATALLFEIGILGFKWGRVYLKGNYVDRMAIQGMKRGIGKEDFLRKVEQIDLVRIEGDEDWKVNFVLE